MAETSRFWPATVLLSGLALAAFVCLVAALSRGEERSAVDLFAPGRVASVDDAGDLRLDDGRIVRIAALDVVLESDWRAEYLGGLLIGHRIRIERAGRDHDRRGRIVASVVRDDGIDVAATLLERGMARLHPRPDLVVSPSLYIAEASAREARRGLWGRPATRVRVPEEAASLLGSYGVVEGRVLDAAMVRGRAFLNFGPDRSTDFTVTVAPNHADRFEAVGFDPMALIDRRIRVRGYVEAVRGPSMAIDDPAQIEVLDP